MNKRRFESAFTNADRLINEDGNVHQSNEVLINVSGSVSKKVRNSSDFRTSELSSQISVSPTLDSQNDDSRDVISQCETVDSSSDDLDLTKWGPVKSPLREFYVLDESNACEDDNDASSVSDSSSGSLWSNIPDDELEELLEEGLPYQTNKETKKISRLKHKDIREKLIQMAQKNDLNRSCVVCSIIPGKNGCDCVGHQDSENVIPGCTEAKFEVKVSEITPPQSGVETETEENDLNESIPTVNRSATTSETITVNEEPNSGKENVAGNNSHGTRFKIRDEQGNDLEYETRKRVVLEEIEQNHFDLLPEGWIKLSHKSGMPVYLHKKSRVCTFSRPYYLGPGSTKNHAVPLSAIPCLQYRRALENEKKNAEAVKAQPPPPASGNEPCPLLHCARIETAAENEAAQSLDDEQINKYCSNLFVFKTLNCVRYRCWVARRKLEKKKREEEQRQRPTLPYGTKLLKFPMKNPDGTPSSRPHKEWIMNPAGKSYVCILHEYVQHALKSQPSYEFRELQNPSTPYSATISIDGTPYGSAYGTSKKLAKSLAAKAALEILIPDMREKIEPDLKNSPATSGLSIFDEIKVEDPRVAEFCVKTTEPSPYAILLTCLQRNYALSEVDIQYSVNKREHKKNEFTLTVGKHEATVVCKNKRDGKQRASQAILQKLHPHVSTWGSLLRLYGNGSVKNVKEKKQEEQEITLLQSKASLNQPNVAILSKLKTEMKKLHEKRSLLKPIGRFIPPIDVILPSLSSTDLNKVNLHSSNCNVFDNMQI